MKKVVYIRTSTKEQTPELQLSDIETICILDTCEVFTEQESAWSENTKRPEFEKIIALIEKQKVSDLYVWDLDRLQRNRKRLTEFFILCKNFGCTIHSFRQTWLESFTTIPPPWNSIMSDLLIQIFGWISEEESSKKSERVKNAVRKAEGKKTVSYKGNAWGRKSFPKQTIDRVMLLFLEGKSIRQIARVVWVYDKMNNSRLISKSAVHKIIAEKKPK